MKTNQKPIKHLTVLEYLERMKGSDTDERQSKGR